MYEVRPYEGIRELLDFCREKGIQLGVNSNKPHERTIEVVQTIFGRETFDYIVGQSDLRDKKPSADGVNFILREAGLSKEDAVYVGDTSTDMMTGHNAEVFTVGVLWGFRDEAELKQYKADAIISKPMELAAYLE
jgi:phosphoglycolate phosphatase